MSDLNENGSEHSTFDAGDFYEQVPRIDPSVQRTFDELNSLISDLVRQVATFENNLGHSSTFRVADDLANEDDDWTRILQLQQILDQIVTIADQQQANMEYLSELHRSAGVPVDQNALHVFDSRMAVMREQINIMQTLMSQINRVEVSVDFASVGEQRFVPDEEYDYSANYRILVERRSDLQRTERCLDLYIQEILPPIISQLRSSGRSLDDIKNQITYHACRIGSLQHERNFLEFLVELSEEALNQGHVLPEDSRTEKLVDRVYAQLRFVEPTTTLSNVEEVD